MLRSCFRALGAQSPLELAPAVLRQIGGQRWLAVGEPQDDPTPASTSQSSREPFTRMSPVLRNMRMHVPGSLADLVPPLEPRAPTPDSLRTGMIAVKVGMVSEWDEHGVLTPYTVLWFDENEVGARGGGQRGRQERAGEADACARK